MVVKAGRRARFKGWERASGRKLFQPHGEGRVPLRTRAGNCVLPQLRTGPRCVNLSFDARHYGDVPVRLRSVWIMAVRAGVAQLVEHLICNQTVGGSSPFASSRLIPAWTVGSRGILCAGWLRPPVFARSHPIYFSRLPKLFSREFVVSVETSRESWCAEMEMVSASGTTQVLLKGMCTGGRAVNGSRL